MSPWSLFASVAAAHALAVVSPGPDLAMVTRQTLAHGRAAGLRTAAGIGCGIALHVAYALFALAWAIQRYPVLLAALRLGGAGLLLWIGASALRARPAPPGGPPASAAPLRPARLDFAIGVLTNALNVKAMLFFVALCAVVVSAGASVRLRLLLGGWMVLTTMAWFCFVAWTLGHDSVRARLAAHAHWIDRAMGTILLFLGTALLFALIGGSR
ncbi:MAG: LysE family transporter [Nevskia sp.]|nr:LysE family transporter [Nevskia sp.]